jgi:hypothetical protein
MGTITDPEQATAVAASVCDALTSLADTEFAKFDDLALLALAPSLERVTRLTFMAQVRLAGEIDARRLAGAHGCPNTATLLRNTLQISAHDATTRVSTARAVLPQPQLSGGFTPPVLPRLADALTAGTIGVDQARTIVQTMNGLPTAVDPDTRDLVQNLLVEHGQLTEPHPFAVFARMVALTCDPDGKLDDHTPADKVELTIGARNAATGLTNLKGKLDDLGVELLAQAIDGLAAPRPAADGTPDPRPPAVRRGQALKEMLRRYLDLGDAPMQGGERPHITVTMDLQDLRNGVGAAILEHGGPISAGQARMLACDARIVPAVLSGPSQVLDVGAASRSFPAAIRRAITLRDRGCSWPGCDRKAGWCDGHHIVHWCDDGPTSDTNGCLLCPFHHAEIHRGHWLVRMAPDGVPEFIPPKWVDPRQVPRRNTVHHLSSTLGAPRHGDEC